ncbi:MAG: tRNA pseudouridine(55) synthase TruB [Lachnospiraceae bacterium]|nr:tRNA pseudouridine(55) synthase TruB [Lachnospiraceae bacterium]
MTEGVINVYKEPGWTSMDVCARLRRLLETKKVGHTGTLDPDAEGVLVVCAGRATRLVSRLTEHDKTYIARCKLGIKTDTGDMSGRILLEKDVHTDADAVRAALERFLGDYAQIPPMYSALKVNGKRLYDIARKGGEVERKPRMVRIEEISLLDASTLGEDGTFTMEVRCSKGTYIRTLCEDIGEALGTAGTMAHLVRTAVGNFRIGDAKKIGEIEEAVKEGRKEDFVLPVERVLGDLESLNHNHE